MKTFFIETTNNRTIILSDYLLKKIIDTKKTLGLNVDIQIDRILEINAALIGYEYIKGVGVNKYPLIINNKAIVSIGNIEFREDILKAYEGFEEDENLLNTIGDLE